MRHGRYINPGNSGFKRILNSEYIDKSMLIDLINDRVGSTEGLVCISRPRRFGKSFAAQMLCAYYDCSCDSHELFDSLEIATSSNYKRFINQYNVICFDITGFISAAKRMKRFIGDVPDMIVATLHDELLELFPYLSAEMSLMDSLLQCVEHEKRQFFFIIDEWDAIIREAKDDAKTIDVYLNLLREWFKNISFTPKVVAGAYITGILPIKKDGTQSAISDFIEYPILYPGEFAGFTGFTEDDVITLCDTHNMDFDEFKNWYDGYEFANCGSIYNPYSVMSAIRTKRCRSFWQKTSAAESLLTYVNMNFDGLQDVIAGLITGEEAEVDIDKFENDFETFKSRDDVLTLLIHLGYLSYNEDDHSVRVPNEEVREEFRKILKYTDINSEWVKLISASQKLIDDTIAGNEQEVADAIAKIRDTEYAPTYYNNEQSLRYIIKFAYLAAVGRYMKIEELPSGHGIADLIYLAKPNSKLPTMIIELKWNKSSEGAIKQIKDNNYPAILKDYTEDILLVGINYDSDTKVHTCRIEINAVG